MNQQAYEMGKDAYQKGDWLLAATSLENAIGPGETNGEASHLIGNSYMRLGRYDDAAKAYRDALADTSYGKVGALSTNLGRALLAGGHPEEAVTALTGATQDESYGKAYKAYVALGSAYEQLGDVRSAGVAYRNAAIDEANPAPAGALSSLGSCFMRLGRPVDAVEAYRTALDFSSTQAARNVVYRDLALAYVAANRMSEAVDAFNHATQDGTLKLSPETQATYDAAKRAVASINARRASDTDALLANAGYEVAYDPLDPTGASGELIPSPEDTGFFEVKEEDIVAADKKRKKSHRGLRVFLVILIIVLVVLAGGAYAYYRGYGWPTQQEVVADLFQAKADGASLDDYLAPSLTDSQRSAIDQALPASATAEVTGVDQSMSLSTAFVVATLPGGGQQSYTVTLGRDGIGWKVTGVTIEQVAQDGTATLEGSTSDASSGTDATQVTEGTVDAGSSDASGSAAGASAADAAAAGDAATTTE